MASHVLSNVYLSYIKSDLFLYTNYLKNKKNISIDKIVFRDKSNGLGLTGYIEGTKKGKKVKIPFKNNEDSYYYLFQNGYLYRKNCYTRKDATN